MKAVAVAGSIESVEMAATAFPLASGGKLNAHEVQVVVNGHTSGDESQFALSKSAIKVESAFPIRE